MQALHVLPLQLLGKPGELAAALGYFLSQVSGGSVAAWRAIPQKSRLFNRHTENGDLRDGQLGGILDFRPRGSLARQASGSVSEDLKHRLVVVESLLNDAIKRLVLTVAFSEQIQVDVLVAYKSSRCFAQTRGI